MTDIDLSSIPISRCDIDSHFEILIQHVNILIFKIYPPKLKLRNSPVVFIPEKSTAIIFGGILTK